MRVASEAPGEHERVAGDALGMKAGLVLPRVERRRERLGESREQLVRRRWMTGGEIAALAGIGLAVPGERRGRNRRPAFAAACRHRRTRPRRRALLTTETELIAIAAPAMIGESSSPNAG